MINKLAEPVADQGKLVIACFGEDPDQPHPSTGKPGWPLPPTVVHAEIGDVETAVQLICNLGTAEHRNIYMPLAVFRPDLPGGKKGFERDIVAVLALVADFDDNDAVRWAERLPLAPNLVLETSTGRFQCFYLFDKPEGFAAAKPVAVRLKAHAGCDHGTADLSHVWRIGGSLNWPNAKKVAAGRPREPQTVRVVKEWEGATISLEALDAALPTSDSPPAREQKDYRTVCDDGHTTENAPSEGRDGTDQVDTIAGGDAGLAVETIVGLLPQKLRDRIIEPTNGDRSRDLYYVIPGLISRGLDGGQLVCQVLTQLLVKVRVLGLSKMVTIPNAATYFATGNNLTFIGDMTRRGLRGRLDAGVERPELREFTTEDPVETVKRERPKYVAACLTILRAYIVAGAPQQTRPLGGFEDWSRLVRDALVWLGQADPVDTMERSRAEDPQREALAAILAQWGALLRLARVSVKEVIDRATDFEPAQSQSDLNRKSFLHPEFREALLTVAGASETSAENVSGSGFPPIKERLSMGCVSSVTALSRV